MTLSLNSPAFPPNGNIPKEYTCDGKDLAPPLEWSGAPAGTKSFALIVDDPDAPDPKAPKTTWVHWVLYDLPASVTALPKTATVKDLPAGTREGRPLGRFGPPDEGGAGADHARAHSGEGPAGWDLPAREVVALTATRTAPARQLQAQVRHQSQDKSSTAQFRTSPSMMRRPNSQQPVMADSSVG
jgi:hypothetical protein